MQNFAFYSAFSDNQFNILKDLDLFISNPSKYYSHETSDIFLQAIARGLCCKGLVFKINNKGEISQFSIGPDDQEATFECFFAKTSKDHVDPVVYVSEREKNNIGRKITSEEENKHGPSTLRPIEISDDSEQELLETTMYMKPVKIEIDEDSPFASENVSSNDDDQIYNDTKLLKNEKNTTGSSYSSDNPDESRLSFNESGSDDERYTDMGKSKIRKSDGKIYVNDTIWDNVKQRKVATVPFDIDGDQVYVVPYNRDCRFKNLKDGRHWGKLNASRKKGTIGDRYLQICQGSFQCENTECPHVIQFGRINKLQFTPQGKCKSCGIFSKRKHCGARKYSEFSRDGIATVKHFGIHSCSPKKRRPKSDENEFKKRPYVKPSQMRIEVLGDMIRSGENIDDIETKAEELMDRKANAREKQKAKGSSEFSLLDNLRKRYGKNDRFHIYRMNNSEWNRHPTYIFKTSNVTLNILKQMSRDGDHFMSNSPSYLDAKVNRVKNMSTYTLSTYHPLLRKHISLAIMECDGENYNNCKTFFETLNEALFDNSESQIQETDINKLFNPMLMVMDENGGNWKALQEVYGEDFLKRVTSCEFHFKQSVNRRCNSGIFSGERLASLSRSWQRNY